MASAKKRESVRKKRIKLLLVLEAFLMCIFCIIFLGIGIWIGRYAGEKRNVVDKQVFVEEPDIVYQEAYPTSIIQKLTDDRAENQILLVNKKHKLPDDYEVDLVTLEDGKNQAARVAYEPLCRMLKAGRREGLIFEVCSAYRSVERQKELFDEDVESFIRAGYSYTSACREVAKETMPPGHSEHATGLAFDIVAQDYQLLDEGQEETAENQWLRAHCAEYGFILRYPKNKEDITEISYESWHFRYVGVDVAKYIMENELTLEEYLEL